MAAAALVVTALRLPSAQRFVAAGRTRARREVLARRRPPGGATPRAAS